MPETTPRSLKEILSEALRLPWPQREAYVVERTYETDIEKEARSILRRSMKDRSVREEQTALPVSRLEFEWWQLPSSNRPTIDYLDFVVDGQSLRTLLQADGLPWFGVYNQEGAFKCYKQGLLLEQPPFAYGRVPLYLCAECGDPACGAVTVRIQKAGDSFYWSAFCREVTYTGHIIDYASYRTTGPFRFNKAEYSQALREGIDRYARMLAPNPEGSDPSIEA